MKTLSKKELDFAFHIWQKNYQFGFVDKELSPFLKIEGMLRIEELPFAENKPEWLSKSRKAQFLSAQTLADKLGVSRPAYSQMEASEEMGTISLLNLSRAAESMNCELIYAIRPKNGKPHSQKIWETLLQNALLHPWLQKCDQRKRAPALAAIALETMNDPAFRRNNNWSNKANLLN